MRLALPASAKLRMPRREPKPKESGRGRERGAERTAGTLLRVTERIAYEEPYFWKSHSRLQRGQTCRFLSQRLMQWKWNA